MAITVEALLPWISLLAAVASVIMVFAKLRSQVDLNLEKDKEQDSIINSCASTSKNDLAKVEKRLDDFIAKYERKHENLVGKVNEHSETLVGLRTTTNRCEQKYDVCEQKYDALVIRVNEHGETLAGLKSTLDQLRQSVDKLVNKIDSLRSIT
jgi:chromosome segregation ATPase